MTKYRMGQEWPGPQNENREVDVSWPSPKSADPDNWIILPLWPFCTLWFQKVKFYGKLVFFHSPKIVNHEFRKTQKLIFDKDSFLKSQSTKKVIGVLKLSYRGEPISLNFNKTQIYDSQCGGLGRKITNLGESENYFSTKHNFLKSQSTKKVTGVL